MSPSISATGRYIVFASEASNLISSGEAQAKCSENFIYRRDLKLNTIERIEHNADSSLSVARATEPVLAANGLSIAFTAESAISAESESASSEQVFLAALSGEPDSVVIEQPSEKSLKKSLNAAIASVKPVVKVNGHKVTVSVQGFSKLAVRKSASKKISQRYASQYEIKVAAASAAAIKGQGLLKSPKMKMNLVKGSYKVAYRVLAVKRGSKDSFWTRKSRAVRFVVK